MKTSTIKINENVDIVIMSEGGIVKHNVTTISKDGKPYLVIDIITELVKIFFDDDGNVCDIPRICHISEIPVYTLM